MKRAYLIACVWACGCAVSVLAADKAAEKSAQKPAQKSALQTLTLSCAVAYMPERSTWVREVQIDRGRTTIRALRIDGLAPYNFSLNPTGLSTALDNERIRLDLVQAQWVSDFRGVASGRGRCEVVNP